MYQIKGSHERREKQRHASSVKEKETTTSRHQRNDGRRKHHVENLSQLLGITNGQHTHSTELYQGSKNKIKVVRSHLVKKKDYHSRRTEMST